MTSKLIGKIEVAERQLIEAIKLFFEGRDILVVHGTASAASQILYDLGKKQGLNSLIRSTSDLRGKDLQEHIDNVNTPTNYLKHADRDAAKNIDASALQEWTPEIIMDGVHMLTQFKGDSIPIEAKVFWFWFVSKNKELMTPADESDKDDFLQSMIEQDIASWDFETITSYLKNYPLLEHQ